MLGFCIILVVLALIFKIYELAFLMLLYIAAQFVGKAIYDRFLSK